MGSHHEVATQNKHTQTESLEYSHKKQLTPVSFPYCEKTLKETIALSEISHICQYLEKGCEKNVMECDGTFKKPP